MIEVLSPVNNPPSNKVGSFEFIKFVSLVKTFSTSKIREKLVIPELEVIVFSVTWQGHRLTRDFHINGNTIG